MKISVDKKEMNIQSRAVLVIGTIALVVGVLASAFKENESNKPSDAEKISRNDRVASADAFMQVYQVLMSPRCMNCHPAGDIPLQGDDSHLHDMSPIRGKDGKGVYAMKCANCHLSTNSPGLNAPPGNPKWAMPPEDMKMVFEGKTPRELALQIMDYNSNGHKDKAALLEHARDTLVKAAWNMGEGRKPPPLTYKQFLAAWDKWIKKGGVAPKK